MDRLMCSYGQNILGSLYWAVNQPKEKVKRGYWMHFFLAVIYISILPNVLICFNFSLFVEVP